MTQDIKTKPTAEFTGTHMLMVMLSFFGVIILVNLTMAYLANSSWTGLIVKNGYIASQNFNKEQAKQEKFLADGWHGDLTYQSGTFTLDLKAHEVPLENCVIAGLLSRPVHENSDIPLQFSAVHPGQYLAKSVLKTGNWALQIKALCENESSVFIQKYRFIASPPKLAK